MSLPGWPGPAQDQDDDGYDGDNDQKDNENDSEDYIKVNLPRGKPGCCLLGSVLGAALETWTDTPLTMWSSPHRDWATWRGTGLERQTQAEISDAYLGI